MPRAARLICRVAQLGLERLNRYEVQLQLPDQAGAWDPYVQLQVAVPGRGLGGVVLAVEAVLNLKFAYSIGQKGRRGGIKRFANDFCECILHHLICGAQQKQMRRVEMANLHDKCQRQHR